MPTSRRSPTRSTDGARRDRLRILDSSLEISTATTAEQNLLRHLISQVNGASSPQPYLVEVTPGRFCLYIGDAAERARTAQGIVEKAVEKETEREGFEPSVEF